MTDLERRLAELNGLTQSDIEPMTDKQKIEELESCILELAEIIGGE